MIQSKDVRVGNIVWRGTEDGMEICVLDGTDIAILDNSKRKNYSEDHYGFPLSPDVLIACGFKNIQGDFYIKDNDLMVALDSVWWWTNSWEADGEFGFNTLAHYREIEYLHQLQNLYHSLTQQELSIDINKLKAIKP